MKLLKIAAISISLMGLTSCAHYGKKDCKDKTKCEKTEKSCCKKKDGEKKDCKKSCKKKTATQA